MPKNKKTTINKLVVFSHRPRWTRRGILILALISATAFFPNPAQAATYYWDTDSNTAGFGAASGTWGTSAFLSTDSTGSSLISAATTNNADVLNFGTSTTGLTAGTVTVSGTQAIGDLTFGSASGGITLSGGIINLGGTRTVTVDNTTATISSQVTGTAGLIKAGSGNLIYNSSATSYSGTTVVNAGTLTVQNTLSGFVSPINNNAAVVFDARNGGFNVYNQPLSGSGTWTFTGLGSGGIYTNRYLIRGNDTAAGTATGTITVNSTGRLWFEQNATSFQAHGPTQSLNILAGGAAYVYGFAGKTFSFGSLQGAGLLDFYDGGADSLRGKSLTVSFGGDNTNQTFTGIISNSGLGSGPTVLSLTKTGTGTQTFSGSNTYVGVTSVTGGVLKLNSTNALPGGIAATGGTSALTINGGVVGLANNNFLRALGTLGAQVQFTGSGGFAAYGAARSVNLGGASVGVTWAGSSFVPNGSTFILSADDADNTLTFQNPINLADAARTIQVNDGSAATDAILSNVISSTTSASGALTKTGAGTLEFSGTSANTYSGTTLVSAGTLSLNKTGVNAIAGNATVAGGTLSLAANNQIADAAKVVVSSGALAIGNSSDLVNGVQLTGGSITGSGGILTSATTFDVQAGTVSAILGGSVALAKSTAGVVTLSGTNTYSGDTTVNGGTLQVTGSLQNNGPASILIATPDSTFADNPIITRRVLNGAAYNLGTAAGMGSTAVSNDPDVLMAPMNTMAAILNGTASGQADVSMQWRARKSSEAAAANENAVLSNVLELTGIFDDTLTAPGILDTFVLQLSYTQAALTALGLDETAIANSGELRLGWFNDVTMSWETAALGNNNGTGAGLFQGAVAYNPSNPLHNVLGAYGVDPTGSGGVVWAVLNHNSEFAVIPEPSTLVLGSLALLGLAGVSLRRRRMAKS